MIKKSTTLEAKRLWFEHVNPYPEDDLIANYKDFLKVRDVLSVYQYNPVVFEKLLRVALDIWFIDKRLDRFALIDVIYKYKVKASLHRSREMKQFGPFDFDEQINALLFELHVMITENLSLVSKSSLEFVHSKAYYLLAGIRLTESQLAKILSEIEDNDLARKRILSYPFPSPIIEAWVKENFENPEFRMNRAELIGLMLNFNPDFMVEFNTLFADFKYANYLDFNNINEDLSPHDINYITIDEFIECKDKSGLWDSEENYSGFFFVPNAVKRFYPVPTKQVKGRFIQNVPEMTKYILGNKEGIRQRAMVWGVFYSGHTPEQKTEILKKYYNKKTHLLVMKVCKRLQLYELAKWIWEGGFNLKMN
jgi:hypothetical protein